MSPRKAAALRDVGNGHSLREHLIATAERLIASRGTAALTVREIAREAGVADGVLYNHFDSKEDLLAHAVAAHLKTIEAGLGPLPVPGEGDLGDNLRAHVRYGTGLHRALVPLMDGLRPEPEVMHRFSRLVPPDGTWRDHLLAYLRAERDLGRLAPAAPVEAAATMIVGVCHELVLTLLVPGGADLGITREPPEASAVVSVILDGIRRLGRLAVYTGSPRRIRATGGSLTARSIKAVFRADQPGMPTARRTFSRKASHDGDSPRRRPRRDTK